MELPTVLRVPRTSDLARFVLIHVSSAGSKPLDLTLVATDSEAVFCASLKHRKASAWKEGALSDEDWESAVSFLLLCTPLAQGKDDVLGNVEMVAKVSKSSTTLVIQRRIEGITQKLGAIKLPLTEDEEIDVFEWCGLAVQAAQESTQSYEELRSKVKEQEAKLKKLDDQFDELVKVKEEHENELLEKFSQLLNAKKLKIRDQQRIISSTNVDPAKLEAVEASRRGKAGPSRSRKRKAGLAEAESESEDDAFAPMQEAHEDSEGEERRTPEPSEDGEGAADGDVTEDEDEPQLPFRDTRAATKKTEEVVIPPTRTLPSFAQNSGRKPKSTTPLPTLPSDPDATEGEETDDEL